MKVCTRCGMCEASIHDDWCDACRIDSSIAKCKAHVRSMEANMADAMAGIARIKATIADEYARRTKEVAP